MNRRGFLKGLIALPIAGYSVAASPTGMMVLDSTKVADAMLRLQLEAAEKIGNPPMCVGHREEFIASFEAHQSLMRALITKEINQ